MVRSFKFFFAPRRKTHTSSLLVGKSQTKNFKMLSCADKRFSTLSIGPKKKRENCSRTIGWNYQEASFYFNQRTNFQSAVNFIQRNIKWEDGADVSSHSKVSFCPFQMLKELYWVCSSVVILFTCAALRNKVCIWERWSFVVGDNRRFSILEQPFGSSCDSWRMFYLHLLYAYAPV